MTYSVTCCSKIYNLFRDSSLLCLRAEALQRGDTRGEIRTGGFSDGIDEVCGASAQTSGMTKTLSGIFSHKAACSEIPEAVEEG